MSMQNIFAQTGTVGGNGGKSGSQAVAYAPNSFNDVGINLVFF